MAVTLFKKRLSFTLRWKIVIIYCLLVFIAITVLGVFSMRNFENYYINSLRTNLTNMVQGGTLITLSTYDNLANHQSEITAHINSAWTGSIREEIFIIDNNMQLIATNSIAAGTGAIDVIEMLDEAAIFGAFTTGIITESIGTIAGTTTSISVMNLVFPVFYRDTITGIIYLRTDLSGIHNTISQSNRIFLNAIPIALLVTLFVCFLISKTLTDPIRDVTQKASAMAQGIFDQEIVVESNDEIGRLAEMFNDLRTQLNYNISEIGNEKSKLETILRYMADGLIAIDPSGRIVHANQAAMRILKIQPDELKTKLYDEIVSHLNSDLMLTTLTQKCERGAASETFTSEGSTYAIRYDRFKDEKSTDIGLIMIIEDITERQKMENMQTDFVANVSHELKTPLTTIKSYTETLLDGALADENTAKDFLLIIDSESDRMNRLVKELLQLSRLDYNQEKWFKKELNLISLLKSCVTNIELSAKAKSQHLNFIFNSEDDIRIVADKDGIEQVILNVLSNAIKYTGDGGRIDIDAFTTGRKACIVITDNGIGIPENELARVFERFYRVDRARSRSMGGTGLGLAISKQIVEDHDGTIELSSREGRGTKVTVTIPAAPTRGTRGIV